MTLTIDATSLHTGISKRDKHLRSGDFFDTDGHPEVRFRSTRVGDIDDNRVRVEGELEAAGERLAMAVEPTIQQTGDRLEVDVTTTIDQRQLGMTWSPRSGWPTSEGYLPVRACTIAGRQLTDRPSFSHRRLQSDINACSLRRRRQPCLPSEPEDHVGDIRFESPRRTSQGRLQCSSASLSS
jgi:hypothetical protein